MKIAKFVYVLAVALTATACASSGNRKGQVNFGDFSSREIALILDEDRNDERKVLIYPDAVVLYKSTYDKGFEDGDWLWDHMNATGTKRVKRYQRTIERCMDKEMTNCDGLKVDAVIIYTDSDVATTDIPRSFSQPVGRDKAGDELFAMELTQDMMDNISRMIGSIRGGRKVEATCDESGERKVSANDVVYSRVVGRLATLVGRNGYVRMDSVENVKRGLVQYVQATSGCNMSDEERVKRIKTGEALIADLSADYPGEIFHRR